MLHLTLAWIITISAILAGLAPRSLVLFPALFLLLAVLILYQASLMTRQTAAPCQNNKQPAFSLRQAFANLFRVREDKMLAVLIAGFLVYLFLNAFLISDSGNATKKLAFLILLLASLLTAKQLTKILDGPHLWLSIRGIVLGTFLSSLFILFELQNKMAITTFFIEGLAPIVELANNASHTALEPALHLPGYYFNNNASTLNLIFWPVLLMALSWSGRYKNILKNILPLLLAASITFLTFSSESETAKTALVLSSAAFFLARYSPKILYKASTLIWAGSVLAVVPTIIYGNSLMLQYSKDLPFSARDRIYIWHYTAVQISENPIFGKGILMGAAMKKTDAQLKKYPRMTKQDHPGLHPHNLFLQVWHELGAIGALFLFFIGLIILKKVNQLPQKTRPFGYAASVTYFVTASFGYGMWQSWLMASYYTGVIFFLLAAKHLETPDKETKLLT